MASDVMTLGTKEAKPASAAKHIRAVRADIGWDDAPCIRLWNEQGEETRYPCTPAEAAAFIRRMSGYVERFLRANQEQQP